MLNFLSTLSLKQIANLLIWLKPLTEVQRKNPIAVFYCGKVIPAGLTALVMNFFYGVPYIVFIHGAEFLHHQKRKNERLQMAAIINQSDRIIVNSKYTREIMLEAGFQQEKISIIHPGADPEVFNPAVDSSAIKSKHHLNNHKIILTVANLEERKGHDLVLQALSRVKSEIPNVKYLIVGDGRYKERLQVLSKQLEVVQNVVFAGKVKESELAAYYNCCDIFVMPNRQIDYDVEGFGISFIEASACGKPVIGGDSGGVKDAVINNVTGYVIDPKDEAQLAEKILLLLKDTKLARELGQNGRLRVEQELTWERSVKKIRALADAACN